MAKSKLATKAAGKKGAKVSTKKASSVAKAKSSSQVKKSENKPSKSAKSVKATLKISSSKKSDKKEKISPKVTQAVSKSREKKPINKRLGSANSPQTSMKLGILQKRKPEKSSPKSDNLKSIESKSPKKSPASQQGPAEVSLSSHNTKWLQYYKKYGNMEAVEYDMSRQYEEKKPIMHPKLGWGFILSIVNDRLEVLFQEGIKTLISNYNPDLKL